MIVTPYHPVYGRNYRLFDADIMPHLKAQAAKRNLGFAAPLIRPVVLRAIWLAEQEQGAAGN